MLLKLLRDYISGYEDNYRRFIVSSLQSIPFFDELPPETYTDIIYNFATLKMEEGKNFCEPEDCCSKLFFVLEGQVEIYTYFEGNEFVLERLPRGSTINFRNLLLSDPLYVHGRTSKATTLLEINTERMNGMPELVTRCRNNGGPPRLQQEGS